MTFFKKKSDIVYLFLFVYQSITTHYRLFKEV